MQSVVFVIERETGILKCYSVAMCSLGLSDSVLKLLLDRSGDHVKQWISSSVFNAQELLLLGIPFDSLAVFTIGIAFSHDLITSRKWWPPETICPSGRLFRYADHHHRYWVFECVEH